MKRNILNTIYTYEYFKCHDFKGNKIGVEIQDFTDPSIDEAERLKIIEEYSKIFDGFQGIRAMHGPFIDLKPGSPDPDINRVSLEKYRASLKTAIALDMDYIIFHSQINPNHIGKLVREYENQQSGKFYRELVEEFKNYRGTILIENVFEGDPLILRELMEAIDLENVRVNLDIGHAKLSGLDLEDWIRELRDYIAYMHIHTNDGVYDLHQSIKKSEIEELYGILDKYKINPALSMEYKVENLEEELKKYKK